MNQINFQTENLVVDYIAFNIKGLLDISDIQLISNYFFQKFDFNSSLAKRVNQKWKVEDLNWNENNRYSFSLRQYNYDPSVKSFWIGTKIIFSGKNATYFYKSIQTKKFDWNVFPLSKTNLSRFDIYYLRKMEPINHDQSLEKFMQESCQKVKSRTVRRKVEWENKNGFILKVGNRKSEKYLRVYQKDQGLEFEFELKYKTTKLFQKLLFENNLNELENTLSKDYYRFLFRSLTLGSCYTDWLMDRLRKIMKQIQHNTFLATDYLKQDFFQEREDLFRLFQFLVFIKQFKSLKESIANGNQTYYFITFPISDFLHFIYSEDINISKAKRQYQLQKLIYFLRSLKNVEPVTKNFSDFCFRSFVVFPYVEVVKQGKSWIGQISIAEQLYNYKYPFYLPKEFLFYSNKYEMEVKLELIQSFSVNSLEKVFAIELFLNKFSIRNQKLAQIKKLIINLFELLKSNNTIEPVFTIILKEGSSQKVKQLNSLLLGKSHKICFYETVNLK